MDRHSLLSGVSGTLASPPSPWNPPGLFTCSAAAFVDSAVALAAAFASASGMPSRCIQAACHFSTQDIFRTHLESIAQRQWLKLQSKVREAEPACMFREICLMTVDMETWAVTTAIVMPDMHPTVFRQCLKPILNFTAVHTHHEAKSPAH